MKTVRLSVTGMSCGHCSQTVERALRESPGVHAAAVNLEAGSVDVQYADDAIAPEALVEAVNQSGYQAAIADAGPAAAG